MALGGPDPRRSDRDQRGIPHLVMPSSSVESLPPTVTDDVSVLELLTPLVRHWKLVLFVPLLLGAGAGALSFLLRPTYTAASTFSQESSSTGGLSGNLAGLAGLVGQLGLGGGGGDLTPDFLASVLMSRELLESTLTSEFADPHEPTAQRPLLTLLKVKGQTQREQMSQGVRRLTDIAQPTVDRKTGIVTLTVKLQDPELAAAVTNRMVQLLNQFNVSQRQTQSRLQREFVGGRLTQAEQELRAAEQKQLQFLETNRAYATSPVLSFEAKRLERQVQTKQEVFLTLTKAYEDARIAEVRDTPSITIIDTAVPPAKRSSPRRMLMILIGLFIGAMAGVGVAYLMEFRRLARQANRQDYRALANAWADARTEVSDRLRRSER